MQGRPSTAVLHSWLFVQDVKAEGVSVSIPHVMSPQGNSAIKTFLLIVSLAEMLHQQTGVGLGYLWLREREWTSPEPNRNLLQGTIKADHHRADRCEQ